MLDVEFAQISDMGRVRTNNEDSIDCFLPRNEAEVRSHGWLFVLADGVGGQQRGEVASRVAVESMVAGFSSAPSAEPHTSLLSRLVQSANTDVYETGQSATAAPGEPSGKMATTVVACALRHASAVVAHAGDSRCYLIRQGVASQLTRDHTLVAEQVRLGVLSKEDAATSLNRHVLTRSLGTNLFVSPDTRLVEIAPADILLQCSDGLHGALSDSEIARIVGSTPNLSEAASRLVEAANHSDGGDNVALQLMRVRSVERMGMYRGRPYKLY
ncbi:MAG: serine/threonine-protein phosphatase [Acidobacteriota bacterium]|nr:serine/threonine-protein phosphatase [Acidobacteriota bacterium]